MQIAMQVGRDPGSEKGPAGVAAKIHQAERPQCRAAQHGGPGERCGLLDRRASLADPREFGGIHLRMFLWGITEAGPESPQPENSQTAQEYKASAPSEGQ